MHFFVPLKYLRDGFLTILLTTWISYFIFTSSSVVVCYSPSSAVVWKECSTLTTTTTSSVNNKSINVSLLSHEETAKQSLFSSIQNHPVSIGKKMKSQSTSAETAPKTQCTQIKLPLLWDDSADPRHINFFVKKIPAKKQPAKGQLWLLHGGPGTAGNVFDSIAINLRDELGNLFDIMIPDHRGTGRSSFLSCSTGSFNKYIAEAKLCWDDMKNKYSEALKGWGTTNAARDVLYTYSLTKESDSTLAIYGLSYGTFWLNRIITMSPNTVDLAVFDSVIPPETNLFNSDLHYLEIGNKLIELCQMSMECNGKFVKTFGENVNIVMQRVFTKQTTKGEACLMDLYAPHRLTNIFAKLLALRDERRLIFPLLYRLHRCNKKDQNWLINLSDMVKTIDSGRDQSLFSRQLSELIIMSEMVKYPIEHSVQYWVDMFATKPPYFCARLSPGLTERAIEYGQGGGYIDPFSTSYPLGHSKPVLTIHGGLDPNIPISLISNWNASYNGDNNYFVLIPNAVHEILFNSFMKNGESCGMNLTVQFLLEPLKKPSLACVDELEDLTFQFNKQFGKMYTLTGYSKDLWEGGPVRTFAKSKILVVVITTVFVVFPCSIGLLASLVVFAIIIIRGWNVGQNKVKDQERLMSLSDNVSAHPSEMSGKPSFFRNL